MNEFNAAIFFLANANELYMSNIHGDHSKNNKEIHCGIKQSRQFITTMQN